MLELKNIKKDYIVGDQTIPALRGINLKFRKNEFVSILGPSGCGKTTTLNIIGGLDRYTSGDLLIDNKSTKSYKDRDWDSYRNNVIGFVFQNYNLISHLNVLDNVEMALSLSGINAKERKERATQVLVQVGLQDHLTKRPNQLSGGQMQRVAIARALVNNPKILLADEPTGALDSKTSKQIMELIQEISKDRLVIMVTHNKKIAETYSDRIIELLDGEVLNDTNKVTSDLNESNEILSNKKTSMSFYQAIRSSFKNLFTKKGRTLTTAVAGSIGIIGVALVFGISTGMTNYVTDLETDTLAGFPITIDQAVYTDQFGGDDEDRNVIFGDDSSVNETTEYTEIYSYDSEAASVTHINNISDEFITYLNNMDEDLYNTISYTSALSFNIVTEASTGSYNLIDTTSGNSMFSSSSVFNEMPSNSEFVLSQYDVFSGYYPENYDEVLLIVDSENRLDTSTLEALGLDINDTYQYEDLIGKTFSVIPNDVYYIEQNGIYLANTDYDSMFHNEDSILIEIVGIAKVNEDATSEILGEGIGYLTELTDHMLNLASESSIVTSQIANPDVNVLTGQSFNEQITYETILLTIGGDSTPTGVQIYPTSYEAKDGIKLYLDDYNVGLDEEDVIIYSDLAETIGSTISGLINTITIILTAFAGISLVVSSIMIGIITYVSVIERTKEIGIMRSLGARKKDISRIFNAETLLIGLTSGILGVGVYYILQSPVNMIIGNIIGIDGFASLPVSYAVLLVLLSSTLTLISGLIPSSIAAKKDPVISLRTE